MEKPSQLLTVEHETREDCVLVTARGELDLLTTPQLTEELASACKAAQPPAPVVVDLQEITFIGSQAIGCLMQTHQTCADAGTPLRIVADNRIVLRPLNLLGLDKTLHIADKLESARIASMIDPETPTPPD